MLGIWDLGVVNMKEGDVASEYSLDVSRVFDTSSWSYIGEIVCFARPFL